MAISVQVRPSFDIATFSFALPLYHSFPGTSGLYTISCQPLCSVTASVPELGLSKVVADNLPHVFPLSSDHACITCPCLLRQRTCRRPLAYCSTLGCITSKEPAVSIGINCQVCPSSAERSICALQPMADSVLDGARMEPSA